MSNHPSDNKPKVRRPGKWGLTLETLVDYAIEALEKVGRLERLFDKFKDSLQDRESLIQELKSSSVEKLGKEKEFLDKKEHLENLYYNADKKWRQNARTRSEYELMLSVLIHICFALLAYLNFGLISFLSLVNEIGPQEILVYFVQIVHAVASLATSYWRTQRRIENSPIEINLPYLYLPLYLSFVAIWLLFIIYANEFLLSGNFTFIVFIALISIGIYWQLETALNESQNRSDNETEDACTEYNKLSSAEIKAIYALALGIVDAELVKLEEKYDCHPRDEWSTKIPQYSSEQPWRKLGERHDEYLETKDFGKIKKYIDKMDKFSIGLAGERGFGKTALMRALEKEFDQTERYLTVWISAPTAVKDEKEFLLSVLAKLATRLGKKITGNDSWPDLPWEESLKRERRRRRRVFLYLLPFTAGALLLHKHYWATITTFYQSVSALLEISIIVIAVILGGMLLLRFASTFRKHHLMKKAGSNAKHVFSHQNIIFDPLEHRDLSLVAASADLLEQLWYVRKNMSSSNFSFSYLGGSVAGGQGTEKSRKPFTTLHLLQMWDDFVKFITSNSHYPINKIIVFIDEVDKMKNVNDIGMFMIVLKALYNPMKLFFVVSISEDALERFRKRFMSSQSRDEFDSSFDDTVNIERMRYCQIRELLDDRILGYRLPIPAIVLIWLQSRGNPREVVRLAREVVGNQQGKCCSTIAWKFCSERLKDVLGEFPEIDDEIEKLNPQSLGGFIPEDDRHAETIDKALNGIGELLSSYTNKDVPWAELAYTITVYELFCDNRYKDSVKKLIETKSSRDLIGRVQNHLSHNFAEQALDSLSEFRSSIGLPKLR